MIPYNKSLSQTPYDTIVVGSGLGGLVTAALLAKAGQKVLVLERHYVPGGFTHTFKRSGYEWDVGVHYVGEMNDKDSMLRKVFDYVTDSELKWESMGNIYDRAVIGGEVFDFVSSEEEQIALLIQKFPAEAKAVRAYFKLLQKMRRSVPLYFGERSMPMWLSRTLGYFLRRGMYRYSDRKTYDVLSSLTSNQKLIAVLCAQCGDYGLSPQKSSFAIHAILVGHYLKGGSYPVGGAGAIHEKIIAVIEGNGGTVAVRASVKRICVENGRAVGVELENGDRLTAKNVVSDVGARNTYTQLLPAELLPPAIKTDLQKIQPSPAHVCLYIGLKKSDEELGLPRFNYWIYDDGDFELALEKYMDKPFSKAPLTYISFPSAKDPAWKAKHPGRATIQVLGFANYGWFKEWEGTAWQKRGSDYEDFKENFKEKLLERLYTVLPQLRNEVDVCEVSTPLSTKHFSNYSAGEIYGLEHTPERFRLKWLRAHTPVKRLFLAGQDVVCVGVGGALFSGVIAASSLLRRNVLGRVLRTQARA